MKKVLALLFAVAIVLCGCTDTMKAKRLAKNYLKKNSNDGKIEIVEWGELEEHTYVDDWDKKMLKMECDNWLKEAESEMDMYDIYKIGDRDEAMIHLELSEMYANKADSVNKLIEKTEVKTYPMHKIIVKYRGNNALGAKVLDEDVLYFNEKITYCSADAGEARAGGK